MNQKFEDGLKLALPKLAKSEGFRENAYKDSGGVVTIGYGFTKDVVPGLKMGDKMTRAQADVIFPKVVREKYATPLANAIKVWADPKFTALMFSALVNMIYNIGASMLRHDIIKRINEKNYNAAADLITQKAYTTAAGKVEKGLVSRRIEEANIFRSGMMVKVAAGSGILFALIGAGLAGYWYLRKKELGRLQEVRAEKRQARAKAAELQTA
jgi:lysozyme